MSKKAREMDDRQRTFDEFEWGSVDGLIQVKRDIVEAIERGPEAPVEFESEMELCIEIAAAVKRCQKEAGITREEMVHRINDFFGRTEERAEKDPPACRKPLTIHMWNNYLSKPQEYPLPSYYLVAVHSVTGLLHPVQAIVAHEGAEVVTGAEIRHLTLGKLESNISEMQRLRRKLKGVGRRS